MQIRPQPLQAPPRIRKGGHLLQTRHFVATLHSDIDRSEIVGAVFLDFKKAFDLVDNTILQSKIKGIFE